MKAFKLFKIKPEERIQSLLALVVIVVLNALFIYRMHDLFMQEGFGPYWKVFERELHLSGYDPLTYLTVTDWDVIYQVYRHPLLAFMMWPLYMLNECLTWLLGVNCVQYLVALPLIVCSYYSYIFLYRIHREVIALNRWDATLLTAFYFSFAYILLSVIVPDHFTISMFLLLITLYISGVCIQKGREFRWWQSAIFFYITAGVTLSNGIKVFLSGFFVNLKDFFRPKYLLLAVLLPAALLWGTAQWEYREYVLPKEKARAEAKARQEEALKEKVAAMSPQERKAFEAKQARRELRLKLQREKSGQPMEESLQFHQDYLLEDVLVHRPVFVPYKWMVNYVVEGLILLLFAAGIWYGRTNRFLWLCLLGMAFDMFIHIILGFGINEIYIMTPHWAFVLPIAIAYLFLRVRGWWLRGVVLLMTIWLLAYNGYLLVDFLLMPIRTIL